MLLKNKFYLFSFIFVKIYLSKCYLFNIEYIFKILLIIKIFLISALKRALKNKVLRI
jgi:hypothetical protein